MLNQNSRFEFTSSAFELPFDAGKLQSTRKFLKPLFSCSLGIRYANLVRYEQSTNPLLTRKV